MVDSLYAFMNRLGYTDPLHPPFTHMPIGLITGALVFFLVAVIFQRRILVLTARHVSILAFIFVFPTILFGVLDWLHFFRGVLLVPIRFKMSLASAVLVILAAGIVLGKGVKVRTAPLMILYALAFVCVVGLGYFGGRLVFGNWGGQAAAPQPGAQGPAPQKTGAPAPSGQAAAPAADAQAFAAGAKIFAADCQGCHPGGSNIIVPSMPLKGSVHLASLKSFVAWIRGPVMPNGSPGQMPAFSASVISAKQAADLYTYVTTNRW
jgi:mono/diheme cytochrome c family protein